MSANPASFLPLPQTQFHILVALTAGDLHGYAIMQSVESTSDGVVRMGPGTLYGTIKRLLAGGLVSEIDGDQDAGDDRRRYYRLTSLGQRVCAAETERLARLVRLSRSNLRPGTA